MLIIEKIREATELFKKSEKISIVILDEIYDELKKEFPVVNSKIEIKTVFWIKCYKWNLMECYQIAYQLLDKWDDEVFIVMKDKIISLWQEFLNITKPFIEIWKIETFKKY